MLQRFTHIQGTRWLTLWMNFKAEWKRNSEVKNNNLDNMNLPISENFIKHKVRVIGGLSILKHLKNSFNAGNKNDVIYLKNADQEILQMEGMLAKLQAINEVISIEDSIAECSIDNIVNAILNNLQEEIISRNVFVRIYAEENIYVYSKPRLLKLVLENLIENAIKHSNSKNSQSYADISLQNDGKYLSIRIEDNGIGIRKESFDKIFNLFYKDSSHAEGGGLGLYIVREALQKLNGSIGLDSKEGCFTKVEVKIPLKENPTSSIKNNYQQELQNDIQSV